LNVSSSFVPDPAGAITILPELADGFRGAASRQGDGKKERKRRRKERKGNERKTTDEKGEWK